jgi:hypothetical protein
MITAFIPTTVIAVVQVIVVQKTSSSTVWTSGIFRRMSGFRGIRCKLMPTHTALILLVAGGIFAITIKVMIVVALWT